MASGSEPAPTVAACPSRPAPFAARAAAAVVLVAPHHSGLSPAARDPGLGRATFLVAGECVLADRADSSPSGGLFQQRPRRPTTETVSPIAAPMSDPTTTSPG